MTSLVPHKRLFDFKNQFRKYEGFIVLYDSEKGILKVTDSNRVVVLEAVQKSRRGPWITTFRNSPDVTWGNQADGSTQRRNLPEVSEKIRVGRGDNGSSSLP